MAFLICVCYLGMIIMEKSIIELEEKFAHLDHTIEELSTIIFRQSNKIDELEKIVNGLVSQLGQVNEKQSQDDGTLIDDRPPHY